MLESEIRMSIMRVLHQDIDMSNPNYFLRVSKDSVLFTQSNRTTDCDVRFVNLSPEQMAKGFSPRGWKAVVRKVVKIQEGLEKP